MRLLSGICSLRAFPVIFRTATKNEQTSAADISVYLRQRFLLFYEPLYYLTVTTNFFVIPLHLTVMVALPFLIPFTTPLLVTVATFLLLLMYVTLDSWCCFGFDGCCFSFCNCCRGFCKCKGRVLNCQLVGCFQFSACCCNRYSSGFDSLYGTCLAVYSCNLGIAALVCYRRYSGQCCFYSSCFSFVNNCGFLCEFYIWSFYSYFAGCCCVSTSLQ